MAIRPYAVLVLSLAASFALFAAGAADDSNYQAAIKLINAQQYGPARTLLEKVLEKHPNDLSCLYAAAFAADKDGAKEAARDLYRKLLASYYALPTPTEADAKIAVKAKAALGEASPASLEILSQAEQLRAAAAKTKDPTERALLQTAFKSLMEIAVGNAEIVLPDRTAELPESPDTTAGLSGVEKALGYRLKSHLATQDGRDAKQFGRHWYKLFSSPNDPVHTWHDAQQRCKEMGGYLVCVGSKKEYEFVASLTNDKPIWTGGTKEGTGATWRWLTGEKTDYWLWSPTGVNPAPTPGHDYLVSRRLEGWENRPATFGVAYVCEWEK